ncbi:outer membrane protein transport protein [Rhodobacteraceae bacterium]|nr:outer membrane protein transport protein [Paracoccaceae bacterium]
MLKLLGTTCAAATLTASMLYAGGIERSPFSSGFLFDEGEKIELSFGFADPSISGSGTGGAGVSGDISPSFTTVGITYKRDLTDRLALGIIFSQPVGADVDYPLGSDSVFAGTTAVVDSNTVTGLLKYKLPRQFSVYGGVRIEQISGNVRSLPLPPNPAIPAPSLYDLEAATSTEVGGVIGIAWERPEIAARVALTYETERNHSFDSTETFLTAGGPVGPFPGTLDVTIPQAVTLEFQTGVAEDTLVFGSVRWVEWTEFEIDGEFGPLVSSFPDNTITYNLGVGRRFNDSWSGAITVGYEEDHGSPQGNLSGTDGFVSLGAGATYTIGNVEITGGLRYIRLGDATTTTVAANFEDNDAIVGGLRVGIRF